MSRFISVLLILSALGTGEIIAGGDSLKVLTFKEAVDIAIQRNPSIKQLAETINIKDAEYLTSFGLDSPVLSFATEGIDPNNNSSFAEKRWTIKQDITFPLKTYYGLSKISEEITSLKIHYTSLVRSLTATVKGNYVQIMFYLELKKLGRQQVDLSKELYDAVYSRVTAGISSELELLKAEIQLAQSKNDLDDLTLMLHKARYELFNTMGIDPEEQKYSIGFVDTLKYYDITFDQMEALEYLENQPEYLSLAAKLKAADYKISEAWSTFLPNINLNYFRHNYGTGFNYNGFEVGISIPLWFGLNQNGVIQTAKAEYRQVEWQQKEVLLEMKRKIENAWHGYETSRETIKRFESTITSKATELLSSTLEGYRIGEIDLLNLLDAQRTFLESRKRYFSALKDYYLQLIELEKYTGKELVY